MDVILCVQNYLNKMIGEVAGMKVLLMDNDSVLNRRKIVFFTIALLIDSYYIPGYNANTAVGQRSLSYRENQLGQEDPE